MHCGTSIATCVSNFDGAIKTKSRNWHNYTATRVTFDLAFLWRIMYFCGEPGIFVSKQAFLCQKSVIILVNHRVRFHLNVRRFWNEWLSLTLTFTTIWTENGWCLLPLQEIPWIELIMPNILYWRTKAMLSYLLLLSPSLRMTLNATMGGRVMVRSVWFPPSVSKSEKTTLWRPPVLCKLRSRQRPDGWTSQIRTKLWRSNQPTEEPWH